MIYVAEIPDIKQGPYNFTDGVGKISWGLAGRIAQKMKLPLSERVRESELNFSERFLFDFRKTFLLHFKYVLQAVKEWLPLIRNHP